MGVYRTIRAGLMASGTLLGLAMLLPQAASATGLGAPAPSPAPAPAPAPAPTPTPAPADRPAVALSGDIIPQTGNIRTFTGNIRTFWGDASPFFGNIRTFWGDVNPYEGNVGPFWGSLQTYNGGTTGNSWAPTLGTINSFWTSVSPGVTKIHAQWDSLGSYDSSSAQYASIAAKLSNLAATSQATWGNAVQYRTGRNFADGFLNPLLTKYGINLSDPSSLASLSVQVRDQFLFDWYDGLMNFAGVDHVDHWMKEVNWSPELTQTLGKGKGATIGLLDFTVTGDSASSVIKYSGISRFSNGHGAAVASLMIAAHDGKGVMGIAPEASVVAYNPFDASQTAGWADITTGVTMLAQNNASVVNMSLGVPGWTFNPGWNNVFADDKLNKILTNTVFVVAAGNDGVTQTQDVVWDKHNPALIIVGSVDPTGAISSFSNKPGTTCLLEKTECKGDYLMNHFIVAPGEGILVSDGGGGVTRMSGTSFAAPLVSGTIALIDGRWPWLIDHPNDVVHIILASAKDLGAPGIDSVYGVGELDVTAALSPLDWNALTFKQSVNGKISNISASNLRATSAAQRSTWEANSVYFSAFEDTGESFRDFQIPLSSKLANQTVSVNGSAAQFMTYLQSRFSQWLGAPTSLANGSPGFATFAGGSAGFAGFTDLPQRGSSFRGFGDAEVTLSMTGQVARAGFRHEGAPFQTALHIVTGDQKVALDFGNGASAARVSGQTGFAMSSDYDVEAGGANPFIGFASGGAYGRVAVNLSPALTIASSVTQNSLHRNLDGMPLEMRTALSAYAPYSASAASLSVTYRAGGRLSTSIGYTMLHEAKALLGTESIDRGDLPNGSITDAANASVAFAVTPTLSLAATGTMGRTRTGNRDGYDTGIAIGRGGLVSSAFQVAMSKEHVIDRHDRLRLSFAQPMHIESGSIDYSSVMVVDRDTGTLGVVTQTGAISAPARRYVAEAIYGRSFLEGRGELGLFGRANIGGQADLGLARFTVGGSVRLNF